MFYSQFILAKNSPLGTVWVAAHLERKLRRNQVTETDLELSVETILSPEAPIALRLSGHLLLGVVRIYAQKVHYLYEDCNEILLKIRHAFGSGVVDLPRDCATARFEAITLPESFDFNDALAIPHMENFHRDTDLHIIERDQITLHDPLEATYSPAQPLYQERFEKEHHDKKISIAQESMGSTLLMERSPLIHTLEEDVLPPMATDVELDVNAEVNFEVSFPDWMNGDNRHIPSPDLVVVDRAPVHVSKSTLSEQKKLNVSETGSLETLKQAVMADKDARAADVAEFEKLSPNNGVGRTRAANVAGSPLEDGASLPVSEVIPRKVALMPAAAGTSGNNRSGNKRRQKPIIDTPIAISNEFMVWQSKHTEDLVRIRKRPFSSSDKAWCSENDNDKKTFPRASIHGICSQLCELYDQIPVTKKKRFSPSATYPGSPKTVLCTSDLDNTECTTGSLRGVTVGHHAPDTDCQQQLFVSEQGEQTTPTTNKYQIVPKLDSRERIDITTVAHDESSEQGRGVLPELAPESDELVDERYSFEDPRNLSARSMSPDHNGWSQRTRSIAQFLQEAFRIGKAGGDSSRKQQYPILSLNQMLKKRTKKQAARMFFEILVLKSQDYIEALQENAYSDISISARPKLAQAFRK